MTRRGKAGEEREAPGLLTGRTRALLSLPLLTTSALFDRGLGVLPCQSMPTRFCVRGAGGVAYTSTRVLSTGERTPLLIRLLFVFIKRQLFFTLYRFCLAARPCSLWVWMGSRACFHFSPFVYQLATLCKIYIILW